MEEDTFDKAKGMLSAHWLAFQATAKILGFKIDPSEHIRLHHNSGSDHDITKQIKLVADYGST